MTKATFQIAKKRCDECLFSANKVVSDESGLKFWRNVPNRRVRPTSSVTSFLSLTLTATFVAGGFGIAFPATAPRCKLQNGLD